MELGDAMARGPHPEGHSSRYCHPGCWGLPCGSNPRSWAWSVAHIKPTRKEANKLAVIPGTYARDLGICFEPDRETWAFQLMVSPHGAGYTNYARNPLANNDIIHEEVEQRIRKLLRETLPELAERPLICKPVCCCADSTDSDFIINLVACAHQSAASGDSGHGLKILPIVSQLITNIIVDIEEESQDVGRMM